MLDGSFIVFTTSIFKILSIKLITVSFLYDFGKVVPSIERKKLDVFRIRGDLGRITPTPLRFFFNPKENKIYGREGVPPSYFICEVS